MMVKEWTRSNGRGTLLSISAVISAIFTCSGPMATYDGSFGGATIAIRLFCDSSGERLALFHFTGKSRLARTAQFFWRLIS
jgi:hypothetical protein